jgi:hypothetical protein
VIPASAQTLVLNADLERLFLLEQVEGKVTQGGKVDGTVVLAQATFILAEGDVEHPVQGVFNRPVCTYPGEKLLSGRMGRRDVVAGVERMLVADVTFGLDLDQGGEVGPLGCATQLGNEVGIIDLVQAWRTSMRPWFLSTVVAWSWG